MGERTARADLPSLSSYMCTGKLSALALAEHTR